MAAKRRLTISIRNDIRVHLLREAGTAQSEENALQHFREYVVKCWIEWATSVYKANAETLPECCVTTGCPGTLDFRDFYAGTGTWEYPKGYTSTDILSLKRVKGTGIRAFNTRHMTKLQVSSMKALGKAWDKAGETHKKLSQDLDSVLLCNTTVEGLIDDLPQCEPFAKQFLNPKKDQHTALLIPGAHSRIRKALKTKADA